MIRKSDEEKVRKDRSNIILIGMPACGKSVTGVVLAKSLKMNFLDTDLLIQERAGKGLQDIINQDGIDTFKELEERVITSVDVENTVIATGGSAVYYDAAMEHLKKTGTVIYIDVSLPAIKKRLRNIKTRGVAMGKDETIDSLYRTRVPLYRKYADLTVHSARHVETTVEEMIKALKELIS